MIDTSTHDIEHNGIKYIMEWTHDDDGAGHIAITETIDEPQACEWFLNDSKPAKRWCCATHFYEGDDIETEAQFATAPDYDCEFVEPDEPDGLETYDFTELK